MFIQRLLCFIVLFHKVDAYHNLNEHVDLVLSALHGSFLVPKNDNLISEVLKKYGEWETVELELLLQILQENDVVYEIGSHIGTHTMAFAKSVGGIDKRGGKVYAFEMISSSFNFLNANVAINGYHDNVKTFNLAVGDKETFIPVPLIDHTVNQNTGGISLNMLSKFGEEVKTEYIQMASLDYLFLYTFPYSQSFSCPKIIKTDAEGTDYKIIKGAKSIIQKCKPIIYAENNCRDISSILLSLLFELEYDVYWHFPPINREDNHFKAELKMMDVAVNVIAYHSSTPNEDRILDIFTRQVVNANEVIDDFDLVVKWNLSNNKTHSQKIITKPCFQNDFACDDGKTCYYKL